MRSVMLLVECHNWACTIKELAEAAMVLTFFGFFLYGLYKLIKDEKGEE